MPKEYIEREKVLEMARDEYYSDFHRSMADLTSLEELLEDTPNADVVKVKHAEWRSVVDDVIFACSNCDAEVSTSWDYENDDMFDYCPCCGAKMDGKDG